MSETVNKIQQQVDEKAKENEPYRLEVEPCEFPTQTEGYITTTAELTNLVGELFSVFRDYAGSKIYPYAGQPMHPDIQRIMAPGVLYVDLFFEMNKNGTGMESLELISSLDSSASGLDRVRSVLGNLGNEAVYTVNKKTRDVISQFLPGYNPESKNFNPMWGSRIVEEANYASVYGSPQRRTTVRIIGLCLDEILAYVYGKYDPDEDRKVQKYDYHAIILATSMNRQNGYANYGDPNFRLESDYVVQVLRNDRAIIGAMQKAIGYNNIGTTSYVPFVRK